MHIAQIPIKSNAVIDLNLDTKTINNLILKWKLINTWR